MCWQIDTDSGTLIPEASGSLQYRLSKDVIGKYVSFTCTPIRDDLTVGEPKTCMGQERVRPGTGIQLTYKLCTSYYYISELALHTEMDHFFGKNQKINFYTRPYM